MDITPAIMDECDRIVRHAARQYGLSWHDRQEVFQAVLVNLWHMEEAGKKSLRSLIFMLARYRCIDSVRRKYTPQYQRAV